MKMRRLKPSPERGVGADGHARRNMIYLDNAATTRPYESSLKVLQEANERRWFNASALYGEAAEETKVIRAARQKISDVLKAGEGELYFLSGGTEGDNTALFCTRKARGSRIIVSEGEHDAIVNPAKALKEQGFDVVFAPITPSGAVDKEKFASLLTPDTSLVSVMHVSNETGAVNDIAELVGMTKRVAPKALFHSDGVQAFANTRQSPCAWRRFVHHLRAQNPCAEGNRGALCGKRCVGEASPLRWRTGKGLPLRHRKRAVD